MIVRKNKIAEKTLLFLLFFAMVFTPMLNCDMKPAAADSSISDLQKQINEKKQSINASSNKKKELANKIAELQNQQSSEMAKKRYYDDMVSAIEGEIGDTEDLIEYYNQLLEQKELEIAEAQEEYDKSYAMFLNMLTYAYEEGDANYLGILLKSEDFTDFLARIDIISTMIEYTKTVIADLQKSKDNLVQITETHAESIKQLDDYILELSDSSKEYANWSAQSKAFIAKTNREIQDNIALQAQLDRESANMQSEINRLSKELQAKEESQRKYIGGKLFWPVPLTNIKVSSGFGGRTSPITGRWEHHDGIDIPAPYGANIYAANDGTVLMSGYATGYGNCVVLDHGGGITTLYAHASSLVRKVGEKVKKGDVIAKIGSTGWSTGNHLHFGYYDKGAPKDPLKSGLTKP